MKVWVSILTLLLSTGVCAQIRVLKLNAASTGMLSPGLAFELVQKKQFSWQFSASYRLPLSTQSPLLNPILSERSYSDFNLSGPSGTIEYRFYTSRSKKDPTKPYVSMFGRYYDLQGKFIFGEDGNTYNLEARLSTATLGLQYGVQWIMRNKYAIDLTLVGFGYSRSAFSGTMVTDDPDPNIGLLEDDFSNLPFIGSRFNFTGNEGTYRLKDDYGTMGLRVGLYVGLVF